MLNAEGDKIEAAYCGTPDHTRTVITSMGRRYYDIRKQRQGK